jgi:hypothetical protein
MHYWTPQLKEWIAPSKNEEVIAWTWYHMRRQAAAAFAATQQFFNVALGGTDGAVTVSLLESNMEKASTISAPKRFLATGMTLVVKGESAAGGVVDAATSDETVNSIQQIVDGTTITLKLGDKTYLQLTSEDVPAGAGLTGFSGTSQGGAGNTQYVSNGVAVHTNFYPILLPFPYEQTFSVVFDNPKAFTTTAATRVKVALHGYLARPKQ